MRGLTCPICGGPAKESQLREGLQLPADRQRGAGAGIIYIVLKFCQTTEIENMRVQEVTRTLFQKKVKDGVAEDVSLALFYEDLVVWDNGKRKRGISGRFYLARPAREGKISVVCE